MHDQGAGYKDCGECDGHGYFETVVGERQPGLGGIEPIIRVTNCEDCHGEGFVERERDEMAEEIEVLEIEQAKACITLIETETARNKAEAQRDALLEAIEPLAHEFGYSHRTKHNESYCDRVDALRAAITKATP